MKQARLAQPNACKVRADFVTLDAARAGPVFLCWRNGARMPNSFHLDEEEAIALATRRIAVGETMCVLRAEIVTVFSAPRPIVTRVDRNRREEG